MSCRFCDLPIPEERVKNGERRKRPALYCSQDCTRAAQRLRQALRIVKDFRLKFDASVAQLERKVAV